MIATSNSIRNGNRRSSGDTAASVEVRDSIEAETVKAAWSQTMRVIALDHLVLTVRDIARTCAFYERALGTKTVLFGAGRKAISFGSQKINLHEVGREFEPKAAQPTPGSADLCFVADAPLTEVIAHLKSVGVKLVEGPVARTGAAGAIDSIYIRDPDANLIEIAVYQSTPTNC
jgi:catechol 2,3-dioxygenase-like lactoylglutathione lyase family enzyme